MRFHAPALACLIVLLSSPTLAEFSDWNGTAAIPSHHPDVVGDDLLVIGDLLVAAGDELLVCDLTSPDLDVLGRCDLPAYYSANIRLRVIDGEVYAVCGSNGVLHVDLTDPSQPTVATVFDPATSVSDLARLPSTVLAMGGDGTFFVLDTLGPEEPAILATHTLFQVTGDLVTHGALAIVNADEGVVCVDFSDIAAPVVGQPAMCDGHDPSASGFGGLIEVGNQVYAAMAAWSYSGATPYLMNVDISDPMAPTTLACLSALRDGLAITTDHLVTGAGRRLIFHDPETMAAVSSLSTPDISDIKSVIAHGNRIFAISDDGTTCVGADDVATVPPLVARPTGYQPCEGERFGYRFWSEYSPWETTVYFQVYDQFNPFAPKPYYYQSGTTEGLNGISDRVILANDDLAVTRLILNYESHTETRIGVIREAGPPRVRHRQRARDRRAGRFHPLDVRLELAQSWPSALDRPTYSGPPDEPRDDVSGE